MRDRIAGKLDIKTGLLQFISYSQNLITWSANFTVRLMILVQLGLQPINVRKKVFKIPFA